MEKLWSCCKILVLAHSWRHSKVIGKWVHEQGITLWSLELWASMEDHPKPKMDCISLPLPSLEGGSNTKAEFGSSSPHPTDPCESFPHLIWLYSTCFMHDLWSLGIDWNSTTSNVKSLVASIIKSLVNLSDVTWHVVTLIKWLDVNSDVSWNVSFAFWLLLLYLILFLENKINI